MVYSNSIPISNQNAMSSTVGISSTVVILTLVTSSSVFSSVKMAIPTTHEWNIVKELTKKSDHFTSKSANCSPVKKSVDKIRASEI